MSIKFNHNDQQVEVKFSHDFISREDALFAGIKSVSEEGRRVTTAKILKNNQEICQGVSICRPPDNFDRAIGRKIALRCATLEIDDKVFRAKIWDEYRKNCK
jgi:hypothetical protein